MTWGVVAAGAGAGARAAGLAGLAPGAGAGAGCAWAPAEASSNATTPIAALEDKRERQWPEQEMHGPEMHGSEMHGSEMHGPEAHEQGMREHCKDCNVFDSITCTSRWEAAGALKGAAPSSRMPVTPNLTRIGAAAHGSATAISVSPAG